MSILPDGNSYIRLALPRYLGTQKISEFNPNAQYSVYRQQELMKDSGGLKPACLHRYSMQNH